MEKKPIVVMARFEARAGKEAELCAALTGLLAPTRKEAGCLFYDLHCSAAHPERFLFYESWASKAQLDAHLQSPHVKALLPWVDELCTEPPQITLWERIN